MSCRVLLVLAAATALASHLPADEAAFEPPPIEVPEGFTAELAAGPPLVKHPLMASFDEQGRLYVAESSGLNLRAADLEEQLPALIRRLEDTDGDGRFDKSTVFADKLTLPQGALWYRGGLYVASPPYIWRFEDADDDGVAEKREILVGKFGYTGNAADIHGCFLGPCGRIYWCDGRHGHEYESDDGSVKSQGKAARIFSCRPHGSDLRVHCGGGMDNPVEIDFTETGEMLGTVNLFYRQRGDCLVHWMHGGVYPRHDQEAVVAEFARTGDLLTEVIDLGHVAVSGTCRYRGDHFGEEYRRAFRDHFFVCQFNTHQVVCVDVARDGSTFRAERRGFLTADSEDFHPTDVLEDADGSLLVIDTGGWFRIGCPTSQIAKPNVLGAIYRVRKTGGERRGDPRGSKIDFENIDQMHLAVLLGDNRPAVRERAIDALARRGEAADEALRRIFEHFREPQKLLAVWALGRRDDAASLEWLHLALSDEASSVRQAAAMAVGIRRDRGAVKPLIGMLSTGEPPERREAATALARIGDTRAVGALLESLAMENDRVLEHAILYALIEIGDGEATAAGLSDLRPAVRRGALIALDQMPGGRLSPEQLAPLLATDDYALRQAALDVISRRPEWSEEAARGLAEMLARSDRWTLEEKTAVVELVTAFAASPAVAELVGRALKSAGSPQAEAMLRAIARLGVETPPPSWISGVKANLRIEGSEIIDDAISAAVALGAGQFHEELLRIERESADTGRRLAVIEAVALPGEPLTEERFAFLVGCLRGEEAPLTRLAAARLIGGSKLSGPQIPAACELIAAAGPLEIGPLLAAFDGEIGGDAAEKLVAALARSPGRGSIPAPLLRDLAARLPADYRAPVEALLAELGAEEQDQLARLDELSSRIAGGDVERGRALFLDRRTNCVACHRAGETGGTIGPDLSTVGGRRSERDLLEAILFPSASLARGFETYTAVTTTGVVHTGLITRETPDEVYLRTADQREIRLLRSKIDELRPAGVSVMPGGLERTMNEEELRDLISYLRTLK